MREIAAIADLHCGHRAGLTPPDYQDRVGRWADAQADSWDKYLALVEKSAGADTLIVDGDAIDGRGQASGGTELIASSLAVQRDMAVECISQFAAKKIVMARGTDYHAGWGGEDWEDFVAEQLREQGREVLIKDHPFVDLDGVTFDIKHHIGTTSVPHTRGTALLRDKMQNEQWYLDGDGQPLADVILRAHAHVHEGSFGYRGDRMWLAVRLPALQLAGTKYGGRRCSGVVHWGMFRVFIEGGEIVDYQTLKAAVIGNRVQAVKL